MSNINKILEERQQTAVITEVTEQAIKKQVDFHSRIFGKLSTQRHKVPSSEIEEKEWG